MEQKRAFGGILKIIRVGVVLQFAILFSWSVQASALQCRDLFLPLAPSYDLSLHGLVESAQELRLANKDGELTQTEASNAYFLPNGALREEYRELIELVLSRNPKLQKQYDQKLTRWHGLNEMNFKRKNPVTQLYDVTVDVPVTSNFMPIKKEHYDKIVESTRPVLREFRRILQTFFSNPEAKLEDLKLDGLSKQEKQSYFQTLNESIYVIHQLRNSVMKDYPFLPVSGVDAALGRLEDQLAEFFEFNLGTPSGLSNLIQLIEGLRINDPEQFEIIRKHLRIDDTFEQLKAVIDQSARAWTNSDDGISVVIGPGVYNGAHPDVAMISAFTGMPLVNSADLYIDNQGDVRLNAGENQVHPKVTGIYSRAEESFLLQDIRKGVGMVVPKHEKTNAKLSKKLGLDLKPGVTYDYIYEPGVNILDDGVEPIDIRRDQNGHPLLQVYVDQIGSNPNDPSAPQGSLIEAVLNKKLFISNIGGRAVDDKGLFAMTSKVAKYKNPNTPVASPPPTLDPKNNYSEFFESPAEFVVKVTDESGGVGVYLMVNLTEEERGKVVNLVENNPQDYIIQHFVDFALAVAVEEENERLEFGTIANDWRIFIMMFPDGRVDAGDFSILIRTAQKLSASTNTSQNGGYMAGGPWYDEKSNEVRLDQPFIPVGIEFEFVANSKQLILLEFFKDLRSLHSKLKTKSRVSNSKLQALAGNLAFKHRQVMELFGLPFNYFISISREYSEGKLSRREMRGETAKFIQNLRSSTSFPYGYIEALVAHYF